MKERDRDEDLEEQKRREEHRQREEEARLKRDAERKLRPFPVLQTGSMDMGPPEPTRKGSVNLGFVAIHDTRLSESPQRPARRSYFGKRRE